MSNNQVGTVYQQIIQDVVESSRVDFEEGGVDEHVLEELKLGWQSKLSQLGVATFPWDPKPEPQPPISNPPTVPSNAGNYQSMGTPPINQSQSGLSMPQLSNGPRIKPEPGLESPHGINQPSPYQNPSMPNLQNASTAQQRAAAHLHQSYGPRAAASINAIQSGGQPQQNGNPTMQQMQMMQQRAALAQAQAQGQGMQQGQRPQMTQEQYQRMMQQNAANQLAQQQARQNGQHPQNPNPQNQNGQNGQNGYQGPPQTDGPGDEEEGFGIIKQGDEVMGRVEIDNMIRAQIESMGRHMEGGGLMLPLRQLPAASQRQPRNKKGKGVDRGRAQMDGGDDDDVKNEELDEDAINSDLDDPDEGLNDEEDEDEGMGHIMLCMYDKVQRVKNKWKCVMKDGVLTVNGREYVFHKASGEYEW
ncbi:transcription factor IIA, alpha/beta subunit [Stipitochalara longipes BDJ]|nr:transcription factor IIA, alpha/beta subunit [Stipitochalara longipes BDJ]